MYESMIHITGVVKNKRKISKTRTLYNVGGAKNKPSCMSAYRGLTFFQKSSILPKGTALWRLRAYKPRIVTINNIEPIIDGLSGLEGPYKMSQKIQ